MTRAVIIMMIGMTFIPIGDAASKILSNSHAVAPSFIVWARFFVGAILILPFVPRRAWKVFKNPLAWLRGLLLAIGISFVTQAVAREELANVFGAFFVAPIVSYLLAWVFLREVITIQRSALMVVGFAGIMLVAKPGFGFTPGMAFALAAGTTYGIFLTVSRVASPQEDARGLLVSQLVIAGFLTLPLGLTHWHSVTGETVGLVFISGAASMLGNLLLIIAYGMAPATRLAPVVYFQLAAAMALGLILFSQFPDAIALAGIVLVVISGVASAFLRR